MGQTIEKIALKRGHQIVSIIDKENTDSFNSPEFQSADVAIEFSMPETAFANLITCFDKGIPVVCGTTGWLARFEEAKKYCTQKNGAMFYASNYSLGVNVFFHLNRELAKIMNKLEDYNVSLEEIHHIHKLDAPSGTAISLADDIIKEIDRKQQWSLQTEGTIEDTRVLPITALREGEVPGTHTVEYNSDVDTITIVHKAKSRTGFALGAVVASEFIQSKKGCFGMNDVLGF